MTNNGSGKIGRNFNNIPYDSNNGKQQFVVSATEVEFLNDIPPPYDTGNRTVNSRDGYKTQGTSSSTAIDKQKQQQQQNGYQRLSTNRGQERSNVVYQDGNNQQLNSAVNKLLDKYAPDANPQNLLNNSNNNRQPQPHVTVLTEPSSSSTFQTNSNNYSTVIRPNTGQSSQIPMQINSNNNYNNNTVPNNQQPTRTRPATNYDSFQHVTPQTQQSQQAQQQQQQQAPATISVKTKNGNVAQVVPGKLYPLNDDPLSLLYDKQNVTFNNPQKPTPTATTFQPSNTYKTTTTTFEDPLSIFYTDTSQKYPQQPMSSQPPPPTTTNANAQQPFDLKNLIRRVQQEYQREIQPFVTSVQFVQKDQEFGQNLSDVDFTTPVSVGKGFTKQADDILRRSFGQPNTAQRPVNNAYPNNHQETLDSKQSYSSYTSTSSGESDDDGNYPVGNNRNHKVEMRTQATATSPPIQSKQARPQNQLQNSHGAPLDIPSKPTPNYRSDEAEKPRTTGGQQVVTKRAQRLPSDNRSEASSSGSVTPDDEPGYPATYNEHEQPSGALQTMVKTAPLLKPTNETAPERVNPVNTVVQRSEDIHPIPPTMPPVDPRARNAVRKIESVSDSIASGSANVSDSDIDEKSPGYNELLPASTTTRSNVQPATSSLPTGRDAVAATGRNQTVPTGREAAGAPGPYAGAPTGRDAAGAPGPYAGAPTGRDAAGAPGPYAGAPTGRDAAATQPNARVTTAQNPPPNARAAVASGTNPNQRNPANDRGAQATAAAHPVSTTGAAPTGSNRFYHGDEQKTNTKRSIKDAPASIGGKIKSIFHRKK